MTSYATLNNDLNQALVYDTVTLESLKESWSKESKRVSAFLEMFLERFGNRVLGDRDSSPEWRLYTDKCNEYSAFVRAVRNVDYYIAKRKVAA